MLLFVLHHTPYAVLAWPVAARKIRGREGEFHKFDTSATSTLQVLVVSSSKSYQVAMVRARSPLYLLSKGFPRDSAVSVYLEHVTLVPFLEAAAKSGFRGMTMVQLKQLWRDLPEQPAGKPKTVQELCVWH